MSQPNQSAHNPHNLSQFDMDLPLGQHGQVLVIVSRLRSGAEWGGTVWLHGVHVGRATAPTFEALVDELESVVRRSGVTA